MPNRWIKEQYKSSERLEAAGVHGRDLWVRLLVTCDDHGRYHGDPRLIASACYPLNPDVPKCKQGLADLVDAKLLVIYEVAGKTYLQLRQWYERPRYKSRFPLVPEDISNRINAEDFSELQHAKALSPRHITTSTITYSAVEGFSGITPADMKVWGEAYPAINLTGELAKAAAWLKANPKNTKSNYDRFLTNWFARSQDRAPRAPGPRTNPDGSFKVAL
jgi:hypothetical protein